MRKVVNALARAHGTKRTQKSSSKPESCALGTERHPDTLRCLESVLERMFPLCPCSRPLQCSGTAVRHCVARLQQFTTSL